MTSGFHISVEQLKALYPDLQFQNDSTVFTVDASSLPSLQQMGIPVLQGPSDVQLSTIQSTNVEPVFFLEPLESDARQETYVVQSGQQIYHVNSADANSPPRFILQKPQPSQVNQPSVQQQQVVQQQFQNSPAQYPMQQRSPVVQHLQPAVVPTSSQQRPQLVPTQQPTVASTSMQQRPVQQKQPIVASSSMQQRPQVVQTQQPAPTSMQHSPQVTKSQLPAVASASMQSLPQPFTAQHNSQQMTIQQQQQQQHALSGAKLTAGQQNYTVHQQQVNHQQRRPSADSPRMVQQQGMSGSGMRPATVQQNYAVPQQQMTHHQIPSSSQQKMVSVQTQAETQTRDTTDSASQSEAEEKVLAPSVSQPPASMASQQSSPHPVVTTSQQQVMSERTPSFQPSPRTTQYVVQRDPITGAEKVVLVQTTEKMEQSPRILFLPENRSVRLSSPPALLNRANVEAQVRPSRPPQPPQLTGAMRNERPLQYRAQKRAPQQPQASSWRPQTRASLITSRNPSPARMQFSPDQANPPRMKNAASQPQNPAAGQRSRSSSSDDQITQDMREQLGKIAAALPSEERGKLSRFINSSSLATTPPADQVQQPPLPPFVKKARAPRAPKEAKPRKSSPRKPPRAKPLTQKGMTTTKQTLLLVPRGTNSKQTTMSVTQFLQTVGVEGAENAYADMQQPVQPLVSSQQSEETAVPKPSVSKALQPFSRAPIQYVKGQVIRSSSPRGHRPVVMPVLNTPGARQQSPVSFPAPQKEQTVMQPVKTKVLVHTTPGQMSQLRPQHVVNLPLVQQAIQERLQKVGEGSKTQPQQQLPRTIDIQPPSAIQHKLQSPPLGINFQEGQAQINQHPSHFQRPVPTSQLVRNVEQPSEVQQQQQQQQQQPPQTPLKLQQASPTAKGLQTGEESPGKAVVPPVKEEDPPRYVSGLMAVCPYCGISSLDFNKCCRCKRKLPVKAKVVKVDAVSASTSKPACPERPLTEEKKEEKQEIEQKKPKLVQRKKKIEEPVVLVLSSDEETEDKPDEGNSVRHSVIDKEPIYGPGDVCDMFPLPEVGDDSASEPEDEQYTTMVSKWCRIGNYKSDIRDRVVISSKSIRFKTLSPEDQSVICFSINWDKVRRILVHYSYSEPLISIFLQMSVANAIRTKLGMNEKDFPYQFDPLSEVQAYRRLLIGFEKVTDENKIVLQNIVRAPLLNELTADDVKNMFTLVYSPVPESSAPPATRTILNFENLDITVGDYSCLSEDQYLNDVIIDFYLTYLFKRVLSPEDRARTHVFSTFFYNRLTKKLAKECAKDSPAEKRHKRVRRWTKKTNLFEKDFVVIPINEHSHWFLAIICFPNLMSPVTFSDGAVVEEPITPRKPDGVKPVACLQIGNTTITQFKVENGSSKPITLNEDSSDRDEADANEDELDDDEEESEVETPSSQPNIPLLGAEPESAQSLPRRTQVQVPIKQPCILIFDSLRGSASRVRVVATLRDFLKVEYKWKTGKVRDFNKDNCKGAVLKVPQQNNYTDCGLYVLQYVESFFNTPLTDYRIPIRYLEDWFSDDHMRNKRGDVAAVIQRLILEDGKNPLSMNLPNICPSASASAIMDESVDMEEGEEEEEEYEEDLDGDVEGEEEEDEMEMDNIDHCMEDDYADMQQNIDDEIDDEDDIDDIYGDLDLEPGEIRRPYCVNHKESANEHTMKMVQSYIEQRKALPVSEQTRKSLKNIRIHRTERRSEPLPKKARQED